MIKILLLQQDKTFRKHINISITSQRYTTRRKLNMAKRPAVHKTIVLNLATLRNEILYYFVPIRYANQSKEASFNAIFCKKKTECNLYGATLLGLTVATEEKNW